jgi:hypothetical protein
VSKPDGQAPKYCRVLKNRELKCARSLADSERVDELLEEENAFEADVVKGVQDTEDDDEVEVRAHEVPRDDVPGEYLDKEK